MSGKASVLMKNKVKWEGWIFTDHSIAMCSHNSHEVDLSQLRTFFQFEVHVNIPNQMSCKQQLHYHYMHTYTHILSLHAHTHTYTLSLHAHTHTYTLSLHAHMHTHTPCHYMHTYTTHTHTHTSCHYMHTYTTHTHTHTHLVITCTHTPHTHTHTLSLHVHIHS